MRLAVSLLLCACLCLAQVPMSQPFGLQLQPRLSWLGNRNALPGYGLVGAWDLTSDNLLRWSEDFANGSWAKVGTVTVESGVSDPWGGTVAIRVLGFGDALGDRLVQTMPIPVAGKQFVGSLWIKGDGANLGKQVSLGVKRSTGTLSAAQIIHTLTADWVRVQTPVWTPLPDNSGVTLYLGNPGGATTASAVLIAGAQLTEGSTPKPYVRTTDHQSIPNFAPGQTAALQLGSTAGADTNDPALSATGMLFGGDDFIDTGAEEIGGVDLFAGPGQAWTVMVVARVTSNGTILARASDGSDRTFQLAWANHPEAGFFGVALRRGWYPVHPADSDWHIHAVRWDGTSASYHIDGAVYNILVGTAAANEGQRIIVGARTNGTANRLPNGSAVAYLNMWNRSLSDAEIAAAYRWLRDFWAPKKGIPLQ